VIAAAFVFAAAALPLAGSTVHVDAGHNSANGAHPAQIDRQVPAGRGGFRKACDTTGTRTADGRLTEARFTLDVALRLQRRLASAPASTSAPRSEPAPAPTSRCRSTPTAVRPEGVAST